MSKQRADIYLETNEKTGLKSIILKSHDDDSERYLFVYNGTLHLLTDDEITAANKAQVKAAEPVKKPKPKKKFYQFWVKEE